MNVLESSMISTYHRLPYDESDLEWGDFYLSRVL